MQPCCFLSVYLCCIVGIIPCFAYLLHHQLLPTYFCTKLSMFCCERSHPVSLFHERIADMQKGEQKLFGMKGVMTEGVLSVFRYRTLCHFAADLYSVYHVCVCERHCLLFHSICGFCNTQALPVYRNSP
jgi:hypothetical protein